MTSPKLKTVGVREFREGLAEILNTPEPVAVTRHGRTIGYYIPATDPERARAELEAFIHSASKVTALLEALGVDEGEILDEFTHRRKGRNPVPKTPGR